MAADCTAYAYAGFHQDFIRGKITLIGCPKLDAIDYSEKLTQIIRENDIRSVTVVRMEVDGCEEGPAGQWEIHPMAGGDSLYRGEDPGLLTRSAICWTRRKERRHGLYQKYRA